MANPSILSVSTILDCAKLAGGYACIDRAKGNALFRGYTDKLLPEKIQFVRKRVQYRYDKDQNDSTLRSTANFLWSLLGKYGLKALASLGQGGGEVVVIPTGSGGEVLNISGQIVEYIIGDSSLTNPSSSAAYTPAGGATSVTLNYAVLPNSETIFYQGIPIALYPSNDFCYRPFYGLTSTTYVFSGQYFTGLDEGYALKFDFLKITGKSRGSGGGGGISGGLQYVLVNVPTTGNTLDVSQLGTFVYAVQNNNTWLNGQVTQSGTTLDFSVVGGVVSGQQILIVYTA